MIEPISEEPLSSSMPLSSNDRDKIDGHWRLIGQVAFSSLSAFGAFTIIMSQRKRRVINISSPISTPIEPPPLPPLVIDSEETNSYDHLLCTNIERDLVYQVISPLRAKSIMELWNLWGQDEHLQTLGRSFRERLHPFKFLEIIFHHPELRGIVKEFFESTGPVNSRKQAGFLEGVRWGMMEYGRRSEIFRYVDPFAAKMGRNMSADSIRVFIQQQNWDGLVRHVCERSSLPEERTSQE